VTDARAATPASRDPYLTVLEVGTTLASSLDLDEVTQTMARQVGEALDVQWCDINEYDAEARTMTYVAVWSQELRGVDIDYVGTVVNLEDRPERDAVIRKGDLLESYVDDEDLDPLEREIMVKYDERAVMEIPLVFGGDTLGVLGVVESRRDRRFTDDEKELLRLLARPAATALGNARLYRQQQEQAFRLGSLLGMSRTLAASVDMDEVLAGVARLAAEAAAVSRATVYEYRPHHDAIVYRAEYQIEAPQTEVRDDALGSVYALTEFPGERAILEAAEAVQEHASDPGLPADRRDAMVTWRQKTCLSLPLRFGGASQGILRLSTVDAERCFTAGELELLEALAESASVAIHNARLFRALEEESERLLGLFGVSRRLGSTFDRAAVVATLEEAAGKLLAGAPRARVWLPDAEGGPAGDGTGGAEPGVPELVRQALEGGRPAELVHAAGSGLAVPLAVRGRVEGAIVVEAEGHRRFSSAEREALQVLANQAAAALENERLYRRAEQEAIRDGLTGLYNHRHFQERLRQEVRRAHRYGTPLSVLMCDLDDFKSFNDQFGHQIGDEALREVGQILFAVTRRGVDLAARYGGEEFAVILPHTRAADRPLEGAPATAQGAPATGEGAESLPPAGAGALVVAERVRAAIAGHAFPGHGGRRYAHTTITVGVADLRVDDDPAAVLAAADAALYEGKRAGRDQVAVRGR
jgi:GGDEF domain-containing protein